MPPSQFYIVYSFTFNTVYARFFFNLKDAVSFARRNGGRVYTYDLTNKNAIPNL